MNKIILTFLLIVCAVRLTAQTHSGSKQVTVYPKYKSAVITLTSGKVITVPSANIFLKNSKLVYRNNIGKTMVANMANVKTVDFDDRHYERIDTMLAWRVDTVGQNALYCISQIDMLSLKNRIINTRDMTHINLGNDQLDVVTLDIDPTTIEYPLVNRFYYRYNGKTFPVREREIMRRLPKNRIDDYKAMTSLATFSWTDVASLLQLLRHISR